jgi:uncharacterized membrane protein
MHCRQIAAILSFFAVALPGAIDQGARVSAAEASHTFVFTSIDVPGALNTNAQGINPQGDVVGFYRDASKIHGFVLSEGVYTTIDYPGAAFTDARGINGRGDIVGAYRMPGEPAVNFHGYLRTKDGEFSSIDFPGHINTIPQRINQRGLVLGCRHDTDLMDSMRGMTINSRDPVQVTEVEAFASMHNGVTPDGKLIVGLFTEMDTMRGRGYLLAGDVFQPFDVPGSTFTAGWDINPAGNIVGVFRDAAGFHGFLWQKDAFVSVDYPGATATRAFGINPGSDIVGTYIDASGRTHGFLATKTPD